MTHVLAFREIDKSHLPEVGGKGANLGEMTKAGFPVPSGFCVTTETFRTFIQTSKEMDECFRQLDQVEPDQLERIAALGSRIRETLTAVAIPEDIRSAIRQAWEEAGTEHAYAVRSSATAEDLPTASFAGQQDTYLNVRGLEPLLQAVRKCWASLFTDRAISYRAKNGFDHRAVFLSVVVQRMVFPEVSGILFTADPISGNRNTVSIDASFGLGEALVSGLVTADLYQIRGERIVAKKISKKLKAIVPLPEGGTVTKDLPPEQQERQALPDGQILELARLGRKIEAHYGLEQDIEWGLADGRLYILQSRPITSLYPLPRLPDDKPRVFVNLGYIQMMTDPLKPLAISVFRCIPGFLRTDPNSPDFSFIHEAGGRIFADLTGPLSIKPVRKRMLKVFGGMDPMLASALSEVLQREAFERVKAKPRDVFRIAGKLLPILVPAAAKVAANRYFRDPTEAKPTAEAVIDRYLLNEERKIRPASGAGRIRLIQAGIGGAVPGLLAKVVVFWVAGVIASGSLEKKVIGKAGEERASLLLNRLNKSLPGNVTTEMGLALGDLADLARKHAQLVRYLRQAEQPDFREALPGIPGGAEFARELDRFLEKYGMRCVGEIDVTRPRWSEDPSQLVPLLISHIQTSEPGEHRAKFRQGMMEAEEAAREIEGLFPGREKRSMARLITRYRHLMGMREHHKYAIIRLFGLYKKAILEEARVLVRRGVLSHEDEVGYLTLPELAAIREGRYPEEQVPELVARRRDHHERDFKRKSPRVMTQEGEIVAGKRADVQAPEGALVGTPVSAGVVEGTARVIVRLEDAKLLPGEILVAPYTDPGWTPLFTSAVGLVTEVGGMMTHGSVVAREYGIPAVVGIEGAVEAIKNGDRIRVNGTNGFVEILKR